MPLNVTSLPFTDTVIRFASSCALRTNAEVICAFACEADTVTGGFTVTWLNTPVTPGSPDTDRRAASRWYCHGTLPVSVMTWSCTLAFTELAGTTTLCSNACAASRAMSASSRGPHACSTTISSATAVTPRTRSAARTAASFSG